MARFGYLVPEFPGQTHSFFWRELAALKELGHSPDLVSTRRPVEGIVSHSWAAEASSRTYYLAPPGPGALARSVRPMLASMRSGRGAAVVEEIGSGLLPAGFSSKPALVARTALRKGVLLQAGAALADLARRRRWTHVHVHSCADAAQVALFAHLLAGLPYSLTLHGSLSDYGGNQNQKWRNATFAFVITEQLKAEVQRSLGRDLPGDVAVAPMGVNLQQYSRNQPYEAWSGTGPARIFSCGRLNPSKGHLDLLRSAQHLINAGIDVQITIAGEDEQGGTGYRRELESRISEWGLAGRVRLLGAVPEDRVKAELQKAHVFALASHAEPLGVAIMEAMAMELPVVATGAGGVRELVQHERNGILVNPANPSQLAEALLTVLKRPDLARTLGAAGRTRIEESFDSHRSANLLVRFITER